MENAEAETTALTIQTDTLTVSAAERLAELVKEALEQFSKELAAGSI